MKITGEKFKELCAEVHAANEKWWTNLETGERIQRNVGEMLMLIVSEIAEAWQGYVVSSFDDHLPQYPMFQVELADVLIRLFDLCGGLGIANCVADEVDQLPVEANYDSEAVSFMRLVDYTSGAMEGHRKGKDRVFYRCLAQLCRGTASGLSLAATEERAWQIFRAKMQYNAQRADHKVENRKAPGGKRY